MDLVVALDAGTTGVRALALDHDTRVVTDAYRPLTQHFPSPGLVEHDAAEIADLAVAVLREVAEWAVINHHRVVAVGITNQRETTVAFDRETGHLPYRAIVWQDRRGVAYCDELRAAGQEPQVRATTGLVLDSYFSATKMHWFLESGALDGATSPAFATVDSWLLWWLTGGVDSGVFATEASNASRTLLLDLTTLEWSPAMCTLFGVDPAMLPSVLPSATRFGEIHGDVVPELAGVPITGVLGDQQAALFGQACFEPGMVKATYGTGAFVLAQYGTDVPPLAEGLVTTAAWDLGAFGPASYAYEGSAFVAGAAIQWLRDELQLITASDEIEPLALSVPDSGGALFVPAFTGLGSPFWRGDARGALVGLSRAVGRGQIARAVIESIAYEVRAMTDAFVAAGLSVAELRADGGAAVMDTLLGLQATLSRTTVRRSASLEATARGAATLAGLEIGLWHSTEDLAQRWSQSADFAPEDPVFADIGYEAWLAMVARV